MPDDSTREIIFPALPQCCNSIRESNSVEGANLQYCWTTDS